MRKVQSSRSRLDRKLHQDPDCFLGEMIIIFVAPVAVKSNSVKLTLSIADPAPCSACFHVFTLNVRRIRRSSHLKHWFRFFWFRSESEEDKMYWSKCSSLLLLLAPPAFHNSDAFCKLQSTLHEWACTCGRAGVVFLLLRAEEEEELFLWLKARDRIRATGFYLITNQTSGVCWCMQKNTVLSEGTVKTRPEPCKRVWCSSTDGFGLVDFQPH